VTWLAEGVDPPRTSPAAVAEIAARETFNDAILDERETALLGCIYIDPPEEGSPPGTDAVASWWVVDDAVGTDLERSTTSCRGGCATAGSSGPSSGTRSRHSRSPRARREARDWRAT
jgi:hypothetical protein